MIQLDYSIDSPEERNQLVKKILQENPNPPKQYLELLSDYLVLCMEKQERKRKKILTENRMITVNSRETSFEGLAETLESGEDGIYNMMANDKRIIFKPKVSITKKDLEDIPFLQQLRTTIEQWEKDFKKTSGHLAYVMKSALIEMRKDQYVIKNAYRKPIQLMAASRPKARYSPILEDTTAEFDSHMKPVPSGVSLLNPKTCSYILCHYAKLKDYSWDKLYSDLYHLMLDFDSISSLALGNYPLYEEIVINKIDGLSNAEIQKNLIEKFGVRHSLEYISSLWRNKIPKLIASEAEHQFLQYYYLNLRKGYYKRCSRCGETKLAHTKYFSKNNTSKDGYYSVCKMCRNRKTLEKHRKLRYYKKEKEGEN